MSPANPNLYRVRKAYEQVADQLREQIFSGTLQPGQRLPKETELAVQLGVSRSTIREALRVLASENLIRTAKGATGGSFIMNPSVDFVSDFLIANINLLTATNEISLDDLLEVRAVLEVAAAGILAERGAPETIERLKASVPSHDDDLKWDVEFALNSTFHKVLLEGVDNKLLTVAAQPIFVVLQARLARSTMSAGDHELIHRGHGQLLEAILAHDRPAAEAAMSEHLDELRPLYKRIWLE